MISRSPLPPPPPAEEAAVRPDDDALRAERDTAMVALARRGLAIRRLLLLWLSGALAVLGWAAVGLAIQGFAAGGLGAVTGLVTLVLALLFLGPAGAAAGFWLRGGRTVRRRLDAWAGLGPYPLTDIRVRAHGRSVIWLLPSIVLCLLGVWAMARAVDGAGGGPGSVTVGETVYAMGLGVTVLVTGVLGIVQAVGHQHWSGRLLDPVPVRRGGGAHR
ncbi:hypothetical protein [Streptomyces sp. NPDC051569]|uniref:hypothetical protein n=1 Tax=Streptomyces sp. NPDC051569 TaxID=3365661 RepID=UPI003797551D